MTVWPIPFPQVTISLPYGATSKPYNRNAPHRGTDFSRRALGVKEGTAILASGLGTVLRNAKGVGTQTPTQSRANQGAGNYIDVMYDNDAMVRYMHRVAVEGPNMGSRVELGEWLGRIGNTGLSDGAHLHFEVWYAGVRVDPARFFDFSHYVGDGSAASVPVPLPPPTPDPIVPEEDDMPRYIWTNENPTVNGIGYALIDPAYVDGVILTGDPVIAAQLSRTAADRVTGIPASPTWLGRQEFNAQCAAATALWRAYSPLARQ